MERSFSGRRGSWCIILAPMPALPDYLAKTARNPAANRAPWYVNTAPSYAGVFLWIAFYQSIAQGTVDRAGVGVCILALVVAGLLCYALYYYAPAMLGMKTGYPLYVVGSSTFGTKGGYLMPGLLMGLLQVGWFAVATYLTTHFILSGLNANANPDPCASFTVLIAVVIGFFATAGAAGADFGMNSRDKGDVKWGGLVGITI